MNTGCDIMNDFLCISKEVQLALDQNRPIVALESTIIAHGMPYPHNYEVALMCESIIRQAGAVPATIAILGGKLKVGLTTDELTYIAQKGRSIEKASRRDIPMLVSAKRDGATTVSATMFIASLASIPVFATGGIGGVHRGVKDTWDISCDLEELAHTNVAVVCAGVKSILDIGKTLEYLETKGVPVIGYRTKTMPAFYTRNSSYALSSVIDQAEEISQMLHVKWKLGLDGGVVIANPIPEASSMDEQTINDAIEEAQVAMQQQGITGKDTTPFLLSHIAKITQHHSLEANIQLVYHNCRLAADIAIHYMAQKTSINESIS